MSNNHLIETDGGGIMYKVIETDCFCGGYEVVSTSDDDFQSEIYTYAAEAQELADELNEQ